MYIYISKYTYISKIYREITQLLKKNKIMPVAATRIDLDFIILNESDKYHILSLICGI